MKNGVGIMLVIGGLAAIGIVGAVAGALMREFCDHKRWPHHMIPMRRAPWYKRKCSHCGRKWLFGTPTP
jgi:hypothetical protein